jgi:hypothetical protein
MRKDHKFDLGKIKEHQEEYTKKMREKEEMRKKGFEEFQEKVKTSLPRIPRSKFFSALKEEEKQKQIELEEK